jgi:transposase-like protein
MRKKPAPRSGSELKDWYQALFDEFAESGQSLRAFARQRGLSEWTLYAWRRRLGLVGVQRPSQPRPRLLEVNVCPTDATVTRGGMVLHLFGRHRVELPPGFAEEELRRLVRVLSSC